MLIAQISEHASDPAAWSELAKTIGVGGLFAVLLLVAVCLFVFLGLRFARPFVEDLAADCKATLAHVRDSLDLLTSAAKVDRRAEDDLRSAGQQFAAGMECIAKAVQADVTLPATQIIATLSRSED